MPERGRPCAAALATILVMAAGASASASADAGASPAARPGTDAGRRIYAAQCAACHGAAAQGQHAWDQPGLAGDMPAPPHDREGHTWKHSDAMLYRIVRDGWRDPYNKTRTLTMPAFAPGLTPAEIRQVLDYLKTLWTPEQRQFQREESRNAPYPPEARAPAPPPKQKP